MAQQSDFVNSVYQTALGLGIPEVQARLAATQAALESNYGRSAPGGNYFGIKGKGQTLATKEASGGNLASTTASFKTYPDLPSSIMGWYGTIQRAFPAVAAATDFGTALDALNNGKYGSYASDKVEANDPLTYQDKLSAIDQQYLGGTPIPPLGIPSVGTELSVPMANPPPLPIPRPDPSLLAPQTTFGGRLPALAMNGQDRLVPGQVTNAPTDFTTDPTGDAIPANLSSLLAPQVAPTTGSAFTGGWGSGALAPASPVAPTPFPTPPFASPVVAPVAPAPLPTPSFARPQVPAASQSTLLKLPSGHMVSAGTYPTANPGSTVTISDDGNGNAIVTPNNPGMMNLAKMGPDTVAGGVVGQKINEAASNIAPALTNFASGAQSAISNALSNIPNPFASFGKGPVAPAPSVPAPPPTTQYSYQQMQVANPAYEKYIAAQNADDIGAGPGSFSSLQALSAPSIPVPPKVITQTVKVPTVTQPSLPTQIGNGLEGLFNGSPIGHLTQLLQGKPVQGGLLAALQGTPIQAAKSVAGPAIQAPSPVIPSNWNNTTPGGFNANTGTWNNSQPNIVKNAFGTYQGV